MFHPPRKAFPGYETPSAQNLRFLRIIKTKKENLMPDQKIRKDGRPKKHELDKETYSITSYFTKIAYDDIKRQACALRYKSLSRYMKEMASAQKKQNIEIQRSVDIEAEAYKSYAAAIISDVEDIEIHLQNLEVPIEIKSTLKRLLRTTQQFESRLTNQR
jgi:uncharacterized protein (DUF1778 family)